MSSHIRNKIRQDDIRCELLLMIRENLVQTDIMEQVAGCFADGYINGMMHFRNRLDLHNKNLFSNLESQVKRIREKYGIPSRK